MRCPKAAIFALGLAPWALASLDARPEQAKTADYSRVASVFRVSCVSCHSGATPSARLDLSSAEGVRRGGVSGPLFAPGNPGASLLVARIKGLGGKPQMPLGFKPLDAKAIREIEQWIAQGAPFDQGGGSKHWAYVAPLRPEVPQVSDDAWVRNPIDRFVMARLDKVGLQPSPHADKATLVRRLFLDLIGLPPTIEEMEAYLADTKPEAYERLVDKLLDSPHFGERQAIGWLDLARYADTNGYEADRRRTMWPYRDWVIGAFNRNVPFDQFTIEQIAGDMLEKPTRDQLIATGFHRNTMFNEEGGVDREEQRWLTLVDRVGTTGTVWLGTTLACAQCHDHKFDPFSAEEFYRFLAFFDNSEEPVMNVQDPLTQGQVKRLGEKVAQLEKALLQLKQDTTAYKAVEGALAEVRAQANALNSQTTLILKERGAYPPATPMRIKGTFTNPGRTVTAGTPAVLPPIPEGGRENRLGLARWLVARENPLTARVVVNRMWEQYFGTGLVKTSGDFGTKGEAPSHPKLLDWLAVEFMESGWDMKHMHRLIATSATYRQTSEVSADLRERDPENRLLARGTRKRLPAELIRDNALVAAGILSEKMGGPSVFPDQPEGVWKLPYNEDKWVASEGDDLYRRGVYTFLRRSAPYPSFVNFDAISREGCTVKREETNTPLQALTLLNDEGFQRAARGLAKKMMESGDSVERRIETGFRRCVVRRPSRAEADRLVAFYRSQLSHFEGDEEAARKLVSGAEPYVKGAAMADCAAMTMVANVLLNLDETITK